MALPEFELMRPKPLNLRDPVDRESVTLLLNDPSYVLELKLDGFRCSLRHDGTGTVLRTKRGKAHSGFSALREQMAKCIRDTGAKDVVLDGEIVSVDEKEARPSFEDVYHRRGQLVYYAFDLMCLDGLDFRGLPLSRRKNELENLVSRFPPGPIKYVADTGGDLEEKSKIFFAVFEIGLEGVVFKDAQSIYYASQRPAVWWKVVNPDYTALSGRQALFHKARR